VADSSPQDQPDLAARPRRLPLQAYFALLVALFFAAAATATVYVHLQTRHDARHDAVAEARFAAAAGARQVGGELTAIRAAVGQLAASPQLKNGVADANGCSLLYSRTGPDDLSHIDILRPDGTVACSSRSGPRPGTLAGYAGEAWVRRAGKGPVTAAPVVDRATGKKVAIQARPAPGGHAIVAGFLDLEELGPDLASRYAGGHPVEFLATSGDGRTVLARSRDARRWVGAPLAGTPFAAGRDGVRRRDLDGNERLYATSAIPGSDWRVYAGEDESAVLVSGRTLERRELAIILAGLVAFLLVALFVYRRVAKPIARLGESVRSASGATPQTVAVEGPTEVAALAEDINGLIASVDRELAERRRAEGEAQSLASIVEASGDAIIGKTLDGTITSWNPGAERMYGYMAAEVVGSSIDVIVPPEKRRELAEILARLGAGEDLPPFETQRVGKGGRTIDVSLNVSAVRGPDGTIFGSAIGRDIGKRKRVEEQLRRSEESYRLLFERHPGPMWVFDPETLRFLAVNETAIRTYGYSREEFLAMTVADIRPEEDRADLLRTVAELEHGQASGGTWRHVKKDGAVIDAQVSSHSIDFGGRPARLVLSQDVTEQRRLEEQLLQARKMEAIGSLAGGIAHDFNNILMIIRTSGALLRRRLDEEGVDAQLVHQIDDAAERGAEMTHQLLAFSRQQVLRPQVTDLNAVVEDTLGLLHRLIGEDIAIRWDPAGDLHPIVVDRSQLVQVILNLAVNARDAMKNGGTLTIRTAGVELDEIYAGEQAGIEPGPYVLLQVTDTGTGMDEDTRSRAFDPFFTTKGEGGTGLGLATVYGIVKQSGGHIWLYSEPGMGTTFKAYFPASGAAVQPPAAPVPAGVLEGDETILFVEDEEAVRPLVAHALGSYGYTVLSAGNGAEAMEIAGRNGDSIDLLLTDVVMPGMNGRELAERLVERNPALHVIYTSGYPADTIVRHGIAEGRADFIEKPYLPDELAQKVRAALDRRPEG